MIFGISVPCGLLARKTFAGLMSRWMIPTAVRRDERVHHGKDDVERLVDRDLAALRRGRS